MFQGHVLTMIDAWKNLIFYLITIISILLLIKEVRSVLFKTKSKNKKKNDYINLQYSNYFKRLMVYFIAQLVIFGPFSVSRFLDIAGHSEILNNTVWWHFVKEILLCSTGMVFGIIYGYMNVKFKGEIQRIWNKESTNSSQTLIKLDDFDRAVVDDLSSDSESVEYDEIASVDDSINIFM